MPTNDGAGHFPVFVPPPHGNHQRPPGYVPGRVAPIRSPPPTKAPPPPPLPSKPHGPPPERHATFNVSEDRRRRDHALNLLRRRNAFICFGVSFGALFLTLILVLSLTDGDVLDGRGVVVGCGSCVMFLLEVVLVVVGMSVVALVRFP
ncbi:hypothetical protein NHX12_028661 [Muraenolepis orangiensis]|uniref:Uncharacterized protein n=1 Tax=Muraenolepis orangiensis TaxID=630683 RepID=A0A9Q0EEG3_9TELE|nr:hypothetical protein NHX12_028661 [Muraenolepis orangiensis]